MRGVLAIVVSVLVTAAATRTQATDVDRPPQTAPAGRAHPAVSPDGSLLAFVAGGDIFVVTPDGTGLHQVTRTPEEEASPAWTREGRLVYSVFAGDTSRVFIADSDGGNTRLLTTIVGRGPVLSPDSTRLLYWVGTWTDMRLMVSRLNRSETKPLTAASSIAWNSRWSPDGSQIAYTGRDGGGVLHVFLMNADGTGVRQVTHVPRAEGQAQVPAWSPKGRQLALQVTGAKGQPGHIWIAEIATGAAQKLAAHTRAYVDEAPDWFPDGLHLAFQSDRTGRMEIWVMDADGSSPRQITR